MELSTLEVNIVTEVIDLHVCEKLPGLYVIRYASHGVAEPHKNKDPSIVEFFWIAAEPNDFACQ